MSKMQKIFLGVFVVLLGLLVYAEATKPTPISWFPSYNSADKIPYGTYVLHDLVSDSFQNFESLERPPFEVLERDTVKGNYLFINNYINFEEAELNRMLAWIEKGNAAFVSAHSFGYRLLDTLQLEINTKYDVNQLGTEPILNLTHPSLKAPKPYHINRDLAVTYFDKIDTLRHTVLGLSQVYRDTLSLRDSLVNFIQVPFGEGQLYLHTQPESFTNYFLLEEERNPSYTANALSYLDSATPLYWDRYYKSGKRIDVSPLRMILGNKYLKWAYYFVLIGILLFVLFEGKRKQRSIPIQPPVTNRSYMYTRTIAGMFFDKKEYDGIAKKQIALFNEFIRTRLRVPTEQRNSHFYKAVAGRSGNTLEDTKKLFTFIEKVEKQQHTSKEELQKLYQELREFKTKLDGKS